jgi:hypothetical protein
MMLLKYLVAGNAHTFYEKKSYEHIARNTNHIEMYRDIARKKIPDLAI